MVSETQDTAAISNVFTHPKVYRHLIDDANSKDPDGFSPQAGLYIMNEKKTGIVMLAPVNGTCCSAHIATLPRLWGRARKFVREALTWGFNHTTYTKVIAFVPEFNRLTVSLCEDCGFELEGTIRKSFLKNYTYYDQFLYGMTKRDFLEEKQRCHQ